MVLELLIACGAAAWHSAEPVRADIILVSVVNTTDAGDLADAGLIYGHLACWELQCDLRFAAVCGSLSTWAAGGTAAQPTLEEAVKYVP